MKKILPFLSCLLLCLPLYSQSNITEAEARRLMESYLDDCMLDQHPVLYEHYFDLDAVQDEEGIYLLDQPFYQYRILTVRPPLVEVLASYDDPAKWDRIFTFQLKKEKDTLLIVPQKLNYWGGYNLVPYQDERAIARPFTPSDLRLFKARALAAHGYKESEISNNEEALLGDWAVLVCKDCQGVSHRYISKYLDGFRFEQDGRLGEDGEWFTVDNRLFIRFPELGAYESFEAHFLKDSTLWISQKSGYGASFGLHLIPASKARAMPKATIPQSLLPQSSVLIQPVYHDLQCITPNRLIFELNGRAGLMDTLGNIIVPAVYDRLLDSKSPEMILANKGDKTEMFDFNGRPLKTLDFRVDIAWVGNQYFIRKEGKIGTMDSVGTIVIEPIYDVIKPAGFTNYQVCQDDRWGLIDQQGQEILTVAYEGLEYRTENLTIVKEGRRHGVIDTNTGELIVPIAYDRIKIRGVPLILAYRAEKAMAFHLDGTRLLDLEYDGMEWLGWHYVGVELDGKKGVINGKGETVLPIKYDNILWADTDLRGLFKVVLDGEEVVTDSTGTIFSEPELEKRRKVAQQLRAVALEEWKEPGPRLNPKRVGDHYALFDQNGQMVIPPVYDGYPLPVFGNDLIMGKGGYMGLIDQSGKTRLPFLFTDIAECTSSGLLVVQYQDRKGLIRMHKKPTK